MKQKIKILLIVTLILSISCSQEKMEEDSILFTNPITANETNVKLAKNLDGESLTYISVDILEAAERILKEENRIDDAKLLRNTYDFSTGKLSQSGMDYVEKIMVNGKSSVKLSQNQIVKCRGHVEGIGWLTYDEPIANGITSNGTVAEGRRMEALNISYPYVSYRAHVQNIGWMPWESLLYGTTVLGTTGQSRSIEAFQMTAFTY
ncbi:MAG TPA: hypothetical protein VF985_08890 [Mariniflexile sp.]